MRSGGQTLRSVRQLAVRLDPVTLPLAGLALAGAVAGQVWAGPALGPGLAVSGGVFLLAAALIRWLARADRLERLQLHRTIADICEEDPVASLAVDAGGLVSYMNRAARARFGNDGNRQLLEGLEGSFAAPGEVVRRLHGLAARQGTARQEVEFGRSHCLISVNRLGLGAYLWRIDDRSRRVQGAEVPQSMALPMLVASRQGRIHYMNPALRDLVGGSASHLSQVLPDSPARPGKVHRLATSGGTLRVRTAEYAGPTGRREIFLFPAEAEDDASNWSLADDFPVPMLKLSGRGRVLTANSRARALLGPAPPEGREMGDLVEGLGRSVTDWLTEAARGTGLRQPEVVRVLRGDRELYLQIRLGRLEREGGEELVAVLNDLTELKSLEAQFVQSQKMQAIGQLAGGVAHDFNNLLTAISGHCDLLLLRHDMADGDYADLQQISQNANRAAALVSHLLAFSRKQNLQPQVLDLREVMADHAHLLNRLVGERVRLVLTEADDLPHVRADRRQLEQVTMNLVVNARDAMPGGGEIHVSLAPAHLTETEHRGRAAVPQGDWVVIRVRDQGVGIPADRQQKIFEPFFTTKKAGEGTGLGLSTAYGIVKQSGGYIFVDSEPGRGTEFQVWLPALPPGAGPAPAGPEAAPARQGHGPEPGGVVLLVEDEAPVRAFAGRALRMRGHTVIEARNGEEALETLADPALHVDVIVTDVIMPGLDGPSWVQISRESRPEARVVFISGYAEDAMAEHQARIPGAVFLAKPFSLVQLGETVQRQVSQPPCPAQAAEVPAAAP